MGLSRSVLISWNWKVFGKYILFEWIIKVRGDAVRTVFLYQMFSVCKGNVRTEKCQEKYSQSVDSLYFLVIDWVS